MGETGSVILNGRRFVLNDNSMPGQAAYMMRDDSREDERNPYRGPFQREGEDEEEFPQRDIVLKVRRNRTDEVLDGLTSTESVGLVLVLVPVENGQVTGEEMFECTILRPLKVQGPPMPVGWRYLLSTGLASDDAVWRHVGAAARGAVMSPIRSVTAIGEAMDMSTLRVPFVPRWAEWTIQHAIGTMPFIGAGIGVVRLVVVPMVRDVGDAYQRGGWMDAELEAIRQIILALPVAGGIARTTEYVIQYGWTEEATELAAGSATEIAIIVATAGAGKAVRVYRVGRTGKFLEEAAGRAEERIGGSGGMPGTYKHTYVRRVIEKYQGMYGPVGKGLQPEASYLRYREATYGAHGSVRLDVVEGNVANPYAMYELKFGEARLTQARVARIRTVTGFQDVLIIEVKPPK